MNASVDKYHSIPAIGGCDFGSPPMLRRDGSLADCANWEISLEGGYSTSKGYERFDGRTAPSAATYTVLPVTLISGGPAVGATVTSVVSGATGKVIAVTSTTVIVTKVVGTFASTGNLEVSAVAVATMTGAAVQNLAATAVLHNTYRALAAADYRADIAAVPGSGPIRGIVELSGVVYVFRDNAAATEGHIYKSSSGGWVQVDTGAILTFTTTANAIAVGMTIRNAAATIIATVLRLEEVTATSVAKAYLAIVSRTGGADFSTGMVQTGGGGGGSLGTQTAFSMSTRLPGGKLSFDKEIFRRTYWNTYWNAVTASFSFANDIKRIYGADGVNKGFEFDGSVYRPIDTGMTLDKPNYVIFHKKHLCYAFLMSFQHSGTNNPFSWSPVTGAGEIKLDDNITGFAIQPGTIDGGAMAIFSRNSVHILYGNDDTDWNLVRYRDEIGAIAFSIQDVAYTVFGDDIGITTLKTSQDYGNFVTSSISAPVNKFVIPKRSLIVGSCLCRSKGQYRLFYSDATALYATFVAGKLQGWMTQKYPNTFAYATSEEDASGDERILVGEVSTGFVYQMEKGTSFDGAVISTFMRFEYSFLGSPRSNKTFKSASIEAKSYGYAELLVGQENDYTDVLDHQPGSSTFSMDYSEIARSIASRWTAGVLSYAYWDGMGISANSFKLAGSGENIGMVVASSSSSQDVVSISGVTVRHAMRRQIKY